MKFLKTNGYNILKEGDPNLNSNKNNNNNNIKNINCQNSTENIIENKIFNKNNLFDGENETTNFEEFNDDKLNQQNVNEKFRSSSKDEIADDFLRVSNNLNKDIQETLNKYD